MLLTLIPMFAIAVPVNAADVKVLWNPNPENDIDHYTLRWGNESGVLGENIQVPADQQETDADGNAVVAQVLKGLEDGKRYFFAVTAVNTAGLESLPSEEIFKDLPLPAPSQPSMVIVIRITIDSEGNITVIQE